MKNSTAINQYLKEQASLDLLRFITCGSVDDGKSTLIGRMLYESQMICLLYTSPSPRDLSTSRMPSSA